MGRDLRGRQHPVVHRGVSIGHEDDGVAERQRSTDRRVHAEVALQAADHETGDSPVLQQPLQLGAVERVRGRLANPWVSRQRRKASGELPALGAELKRPGVFLVLDQNHRRADRSRFRADRVDSLDDSVDIESGFFAGAQSVLNVDDEECSRHGM